MQVVSDVLVHVIVIARDIPLFQIKVSNGFGTLKNHPMIGNPATATSHPLFCALLFQVL